MIKIYSAKITEFTQADYAEMYSLLERDIQQKIDAKKCEEDRLSSLAGYILLHRGMREIYNKTHFKLSFNKHGKPLCDFCHFNISHSAGYVFCAFSDRSIGVDVQKITDIKPKEKYRFFNEKENVYVNQDRDSVSRKYIEIFTKKEAAVKMLGLPLTQSGQIDTFSSEFCFKTEIIEDFVFTLCT